MKTIKKQLGTIALCIGILLSVNLSAQQQKHKENNTFVRVFSKTGKKIAKGCIEFTNDSILSLINGNKLKQLNVKEIGYIKTKKSVGHNVLMATAAGASIGVILGVSTADSNALFGYTAGEGGVAFSGLGVISGAALGGITSAFKNSETFIIDGDINKWKIYKELL